MGFTSRKFYVSLIWAGFMGLSACSQQASSTLPTVAGVDLPRYMGTWYEIGHLPNWFQKKCVSDTTANYTLEDDHVAVHNRCRIKDGSWASATGIAYPVDGSSNAKLRVSFFRPFYGDYWVIGLDQGYQWALIGSPKRDYGWVLSRTPTLPAATLLQIEQQARQLGYDPSQFMMTVQRSQK